MKTQQPKKRLQAVLALFLIVSLMSTHLVSFIYADPDGTEALSEEITPICGLEAHTHAAESCFKPLTTLICTIQEGSVHIHEEVCYQLQDSLVCELAEAPAHLHTDTCYSPDFPLICGREETTGHAHLEQCYTPLQNLTCGKQEGEGHTHGEACSTLQTVLTCELAESDTHTHDGQLCYGEGSVCTCTLEETEGHTHEEACYTTELIVTCGQEIVEAHTHEPACYGTEKPLVCSLTETEGHTHGDTCYEKISVQICTLGTDAPHTHGEGCYAVTGTETICLLPEHTHTDACYPTVSTLIPTELVEEYVTVSGALPAGVELQAQVYDIESYDRLKQQVMAYLQEGEEVALGYEISLLLDGAEYQPEGAVTVTVTVPEVCLQWAAVGTVGELADKLTLYHVHDDGDVRELAFTAHDESGTLTFIVDRFSAFIGTVKTDTSVYLSSGEGYRFYKNTSALSGYVKWESGLTITVKPMAGYALQSVTVTDEAGSPVDDAQVTQNTDGTYTIAFLTEPTSNRLIAVETEKVSVTGDVIYFDLSAGNITIDDNQYTGYRFDGQDTEQPITGTWTSGQYYYVYQSNGDKNTGFLPGDTQVTLPDYSARVTAANGESWGDFITNNTDVESVIEGWNDAAKAGRESTEYRIHVIGTVDTTMVIDNVWSSYHNKYDYREDGGIAFLPSGAESALKVYLKGDNRVGNIYYTSSNTAYTLCIDGDADATLTVADFNADDGFNHFNSAIGASDYPQDAIGIVINGGILFAGTTAADDCTAIGGGGNGYGGITINGGTVTAVTTSSGTAIGGGIGKTSNGGAADVTINGGTVYAYNSSCAAGTYSNTGVKYIPAAAIGGGSSAASTCSESKVTINGGYVYAQSVGGTAIGGGSSSDTHGGDATIIITGGEVYAKSISGKIAGQDVPAGAAIGGGTGGTNGNGGYADLLIVDGAVVTGSIGGGDTLNETGTNTIGYAKVEIDGGDLQGQVVMAAGADDACSFTMTGGTLSKSPDEYIYLQEDGGAVYMDDPNGVATMTGGTISGCTAQNGGAIYMTAGSFTLSGGGEISGNEAAANGGAVYMGGGELHISGGEISGNRAAINGGGAYVKNGSVYMSGGAVDNNAARTGAGGGMYVSAENANVTVDVYSGSISGNTARTSGGAVAVVGAADGTEVIDVTVGVNQDHSGGSFTHGENSQYTHTSCPEINGNTADTSGGAVYVKGSSQAKLNIYCLTEQDNQVGGEDEQSLSDFMMVEGGQVLVSSAGGGNTTVHNSVHVLGGHLQLEGAMTNPIFNSSITVDVTKEGDGFTDKRPMADYYKLLYYENFKDPRTGKVTGQYTAYQVPADNAAVTISGVIYSHPGYEIVGWNTLAEPTDDDRGEWYDVSAVYTLTEDLTIYAIWEAHGYTIEFEPNVRRGDTYRGEMEPQDFSYNVADNLNANVFQYPGHIFTGWNTRAGGGGTAYVDEAEIYNLTYTDGATIVLYAQWVPCTHDPATTQGCTFTYTWIDDNTLQRDCNCEGQTLWVDLYAEDTVYDGLSHPAEAIYTDASYWAPGITYAEAGTSGEELENAPVNAGTYVASIIAGGEKINVTYLIDKAPQDPPEVSGFTVDGNTLTVNPVAPSEKTTGANADTAIKTLYQLFYYDGDEVISGEIKETGVFTLSEGWTNYYVEVWYSEGANHKESQHTRTYKVFYEGDTRIEFVVGEGVEYLPEASSTGGLQITVSAKDGYYLTDSYNVTVTDTKHSASIAENTQSQGSGDNRKATRVYLLTNVPNEAGHVVTVTIPSAAKATSATSAVTEKQVFGTVTGTSATVSRDSAFTACYTVSGYDTTIYSNMKLTFSSTLPTGTTLILLDKTNHTYWHYTAGGTESSILLTEFTRMGGAELFVVDGAELCYQFIVDFSRSAGCSGDSLTMTLTANKSETFAATLEPAVSVTLEDPASFNLAANGSGRIQTFTTTYTPSEGAASIWDNRRTALVLTPQAVLPADARLLVTVSGAKIEYYRNADGNYIIPLSAPADSQVTAELRSALFPAAQMAYSFRAQWYVSNSQAGKAPENGQKIAPETQLAVTFTKAADTVPSLKVTGDQRVLTVKDKLTVAVAMRDMDGCTVSAALLRKGDNGEYSSTAQKPAVSDNMSIPLSAQSPGSFCLMFTVKEGINTILQVPYYFIIQ